MPRGGGGFGGGFRGGGSIGFGGGFRSSSFGTSSAFGRTGAARFTNRPTSGPYTHIRRPYYPYYGFGFYRPWYFSPFWGYYYRPWYYSPIYIGGGIIFFIILLLIILPIAGIAIAFPFDNADVNGNVIYRDTQTLYFNEYWYEYEDMKAGNNIVFSVQSNPSYITFIIDNRNFYELPKTTKIYHEIDSFSLLSRYYQYIQVFLNYGSIIYYNFTSTGPVKFFISDGNNLNRWISSQSYSFLIEKSNTLGESGYTYVYESKDYYIVWANYGSSSVNINYNLTYHAANVIDTTQVYFAIEKTKFISESTFTVPSDGQWYFYIYFDPLNAPEESTTITFDVKFETGITAKEKWASARPLLIGIAVFIMFILIIGLIARKVQKKNKDKLKMQHSQQAQTQQTIQTQQVQTTQTPISYSAPSTIINAQKFNCTNCGYELTYGLIYCPNCGKRVEGRSTNINVSVPLQKYCKLCGNELKPTDKFCTECGAKLQQN